MDRRNYVPHCNASTASDRCDAATRAYEAEIRSHQAALDAEEATGLPAESSDLDAGLTLEEQIEVVTIERILLEEELEKAQEEHFWRQIDQAMTVRERTVAESDERELCMFNDARALHPYRGDDDPYSMGWHRLCMVIFELWQEFGGHPTSQQIAQVLAERRNASGNGVAELLRDAVNEPASGIGVVRGDDTSRFVIWSARHLEEIVDVAHMRARRRERERAALRTLETVEAMDR